MKTEGKLHFTLGDRDFLILQTFQLKSGGLGKDHGHSMAGGGSMDLSHRTLL